MSSTYGTLPSTDNDDDTLVSAGKCTVVQTVVNTVMIITGAGMLSLPYAAANVGWSCVVVLVVVAGVFMYAFDLVAEALEQLIARHATTHDRRQYVASLTYISLAEAAFGPRGAGLVTLSLSVELFLALTSFFINIGLNLQTVFAAVDVATGIGLAATLTCVLASLDLQYASYTSALGVCLTGLLLVALLVAGAQLPVSPSAATAYVFFVPQRLPVSLGLVAFCFGGVGAFPQIYTSMQHRSACRVALVAAGTIVLALYASVMVAGYAIYGQYAAEVVTRNLGRSLLGEDLPRGHIVRVIAAVGVLFNIQVTCPLVCLPVRDMLAHAVAGLARRSSPTPKASPTGPVDTLSVPSLSPSPLPSRPLQLVCTAVTVLAVYCAALACRDHFANVAALVGDVLTVVNSLVLPILFYHSLVGAVGVARGVAHVGILAVAVAVACVGAAGNVCALAGSSGGGGWCAYVAAR